MIWSCGAHLGDALWTANFLRRMPGEHTFHVLPEYVNGIAELMSDRPVKILSTEDNRPADARDTWIANASLEGRGVFYRGQEDIMGFVMEYHNHLGGEAGMPCPVYNTRQEMLWDSASILAAVPRVPHPDLLVINSDPRSGQCPEYSRSEMMEVIETLRHRYPHLRITCTNINGVDDWSLAEIAAMSITAKYIVAVANGPHWATWNIWNQNAHRVILLSPMRLDFSTPGKTEHAANAAGVWNIMRGWL